MSNKEIKVRAANAFRAMKAIGISEDKVKPVLKNLVKLYDKNWALIEEENYRALADAIFEREEAEAQQRPKKDVNTEAAERPKKIVNGELAFFTTRKVKAMEELTWLSIRAEHCLTYACLFAYATLSKYYHTDYGIEFDDYDHPLKAFHCQCGSKFCRNIKRSSSSPNGKSV
ncbi:UNVERIFIED_CONTAM: putative inactive histone-lysine N-methyltransferase SUVR2 [Sesamum indicum]